MKEIDKSSLSNARTMAVEAVCLIEEAFPRSILSSQLHVVVHLIDEIAICGVVHSRWMFFLERFLKTLKGFVRQRARPEGSMAEGWLVQESFVYMSEYLCRIDPSMPRLWSMEVDERLISHVPQGKGKPGRMDQNMLQKINSFCIRNAHIMEKWIQRFTTAQQTRDEQRRTYRRAHRGVQFPPELAKLSDDYMADWLHEEMETFESENGEGSVSPDEWEYGRGCEPKVKYFYLC